MTNDTHAQVQSRMKAAEREMDSQSIVALFVAPSADLAYLAGYGGHASERPTLLVIRPGAEPLMLLPELEAPRAASLGIQLLPYNETQDPYRTLATAVGEFAAESRAAISDQAWSAVLLGLQRVFAISFMPASPLLRELRMRKSAEELQWLAEAGAKADAAFNEVVRERFSGRTEREVAGILSEGLGRQGLVTGPWGPIVASGPNSASPHHLTGDRVIEQGDAVVLDFGGTVQGYHADITRTVHVGEPTELFRSVYGVVRDAQEAGVQAIRPGVSASRVDEVTREVIANAGYGNEFVHRTGHGIGLDGHEEPYIVAGNSLPLEPGMAFSVEPGIYLSGRFGVRVEDIVAVTEGGACRMNDATRDLVVVG